MIVTSGSAGEGFAAGLTGLFVTVRNRSGSTRLLRRLTNQNVNGLAHGDKIRWNRVDSGRPLGRNVRDRKGTFFWVLYYTIFVFSVPRRANQIATFVCNFH